MKLYEKNPVDCCGNCVHFRRHYVLRDGYYMPLLYGHCVFPRLKDRREDGTCPHFKSQETT